jgi:D-sedoheptulose 7-phosphate isomerase|tara:strand:- start:4 stop:591 length:588 start_codon:yes stop_codon:yes gene_type:complete
LKKNTSLEKSILQSVNLQKKLIANKDEIKNSINLIFKTIKLGGTVFLCGNGGSAADAQHLAAELVVRLRPNINRKGLPAIALSADTSYITACGNDYGFKKIFSRGLQALSKKNDLLIVISTSGKSENIIEALKYSKKNKIKTIGLLGKGGGRAKNFCDTNIIIPSNSTARIQEMHIFLGHFILEEVENLIFNITK